MRAIALVPLLIALTPRGPHGPIGDIKRVTRQRVRYRSLAARKPKELRSDTESLSSTMVVPEDSAKCSFHTSPTRRRDSRALSDGHRLAIG